MSGDGTVPYQYLVLRCVPRVDREEFLNVGVVLYSQRADFLRCASAVDAERLRALDSDVDVAAVRASLSAVEAECRGDASAGEAGQTPLGVRFGHVAAPRSTVVQPGPVHGGRTTADRPDPRDTLEHLLDCLVRRPVAGSRPHLHPPHER